MLVAMTLAGRGRLGGGRHRARRGAAHGDAVDDVDVLGNLGNAALQLGDDDAQQHFYALALSRAREAGARHGGDLRAAAAVLRLPGRRRLGGGPQLRRGSARARHRPGAARADRSPLAWLTLLAALQGRDDYDGLLADLEEVVAAYPLGILTDPVHDLTRWAKGAHAAAPATPSAPCTTSPGCASPRWPAWPRPSASTQQSAPENPTWPGMGRGARRLRRSHRPTLGTGHRRLRTRDDRRPARTAEPLFGDALAHHAHAGRAYDKARTHLAYGEWLRRTQRRVDAREHLRHALETFGDLRADPLVRRATEELRASGETARKRTRPPWSS